MTSWAFKRPSDHANFCRFVCDFMGGEMTAPDTLRVAGKCIRASVFPVGIDVEFVCRHGAKSRGGEENSTNSVAG